MLRLFAWVTAAGGAIAATWKGLPFARWLYAKVHAHRDRQRQTLLLTEDVAALILIATELVGSRASDAGWKQHIEDHTDELFNELDRQLHVVGRRLNRIEATLKEHAT